MSFFLKTHVLRI